MVAIALRTVQILPNHHKRLANVIEDLGPKVGRGKAQSFLFPAYLFLREKPPSWFWGMTGVIRVLRYGVRRQDLDVCKSEYLQLERMRKAAEVKRDKNRIGQIERAVIAVRDESGSVICRVNMFGRELDMKVLPA